MARIKLGELIDQTLSSHEQTKLLLRMREMLRDEDVRQQEHGRKGRERRKLPNVARVKRKQTSRLLTVLHTSTDPAQLVAARTELAGQSADDARELHTPTGQQQHDETRAGALLAHHSRARASFWAQLGPAPHCGPGETATAMLFYRKVTRLLDGGGWTHHERAALHDLAAKWGPRALGNDARFNVVGTVGGRLPRALELKIKEMQKLRG